MADIFVFRSPMKSYAKDATIKATKAEIQDHMMINASSPATVIMEERITSSNALYRTSKLIV